MTLHKLLYNSFKNKDGNFSHLPKDQLDYDYELIIIDEVSMVSKQIWEQALKHDVHIIALGDPFQLPAISEGTDILNHPHVFLDEVMRQALESDIIRLSMDVRSGKPLKPLNGNDVKVIRKSELVSGMYTWADQIICGKNTTRRLINNQFREMLSFGVEPQEGDKVICLRNYWDTQNDNGDPLINGMIGTLKSVSIGKDNGVLGRSMKIDFAPDFGVDNSYIFNKLKVDYKLIKEGNPTFTKDAKPIYKNGKKQPLPMEFDYGYAITCWKAQGSQFNNVLFIAEKVGRMSDIDYARFLYTGITRAVSKIVVVLP